MLPILYQSPDFVLYAYPLLMGLGWGIAYQVFFSLIGSDYPRLKAQFLFWGIFLSGWVGAKIFFLLTYPESYNYSLAREISFWTGGGFVFYGGFLGAVIFLGLFRIFEKSYKFNLLWAMVPALALGHGIGRIGCFLAGCCYGKPTEFFWGIYLHEAYRHPTQLLEACALLILGAYLLRSSKTKATLMSHYLMSYGILRFLIESLRGDLIRGQWGYLTPSQWISLGLLFSGLALRVSIYRRSTKVKQSSFSSLFR